MKTTTKAGFSGVAARGMSTIGAATICAAIALLLGGTACDMESNVGDPHEDDDETALDGDSEATADAASAHKLRPEEIQGVVRGAFGQFRQCYEALLKSSPTAEGKVTVHFRIDEEGEVLDVTAESTFADATIGTCVADHFEQLRFAAHDETTTVTYPIAFSPGE